MSKAYILTAVDQGETCDGKARALGIHFSYEDAARAKSEDMTTYRNTCLALSGKEPLSYNEGRGYCYINDRQGCEWNIEEVDIRIPLTPMQVSSLNSLALNIAGNPKSFADYENLSEEERVYLVDTLKNTYHININKEDK